MCHGGRHRARRHFGGRLGSRFYERENVVDRLDEYQRDLEQELADVSELIRRLRESEAEPKPETVQL